MQAVSLLLSFSAYFTKESSFYLYYANSKVCSAQLEILSAALNSLQNLISPKSNYFYWKAIHPAVFGTLSAFSLP